MDADQRDDFNRLLEAFHQAQERGDVQEAELIGIQCLLLATEESEKNPNEYLRLVGEANEYENVAQWEQAEIAYRQALGLAEVAGNPALTFKVYHDLSALYSMRGMPEKALVEARAAAEAARKTDMAAVIGMAFENLAQCYLSVGNAGAASTVADELVAITPAEKISDLLRARALLMQARCRLEGGEVKMAQANLDIAWQILAPQANALIFAGVQSALASWWELTAGINALEKDPAGAARAMEKAVEFRRTISALPQLAGAYKYFALAKLLQRYSVALWAINDVEAATSAFEESRAIQQRIGVTLS